MKSAKIILVRYFALCMIPQVGAMVYMTTPSLEKHRAAVAKAMGLTENGIWIPVSFILLIFMCATLLRLISLLATPFRELAQRSERGDKGGYAFRKKSKTREEDSIKHYIESQTLKVNELDQQIEELDEEINRLTDEFDAISGKDEEQEQTIMELRKVQRKLNAELDALKAENSDLENELSQERKSTIGMEVEKRTDEICAHMERAVTNCASKSIMMPGIVHELKTPAAIINKITTRLKGSWGDISFARLKEDIDEITTQSEIQMSLIENPSLPEATPEQPAEKLLLEQPKDTEPTEATPKEAKVEEVEVEKEKEVVVQEEVLDTEQAEMPILLDVIEERAESAVPETDSEEEKFDYRNQSVVIDIEESKDDEVDETDNDKKDPEIRFDLSKVPLDIVIPSDNPGDKDLIDGPN